jgi:osmotically-inducible protein OsmY
MNGVIRRLVLFIASIVLVSALGYASTSNREGTGVYVDDTVVTTKVKAAIFNEPTLKSAEVNVETFKGVVQLTGFVTSLDARSTAVRVTRDVPGVKSVKDDMRVK